MYRIYLCLITMILLVFFCRFEASAQIKTAQPSKVSLSRAEMLKLIYNMGKAYSAVNDYSAVFVKQDRLNGKMREEETIKVYFKKPFNVYMEWIKDPYKGRQAVFRKGYNDDKLLVKSRILLGNRLFAIDPKGDLALRNNRHPVTEMGIGYLAEMLLNTAERGEKNNELKLLYRGEQEVYGRKVYKIEGILPKDRSKGYYCYRAIIGIDKQNGLPIMLETYMWDDQLYERYVYSELKLNIGVKDDIFESIK